MGEEYRRLDFYAGLAFFFFNDRDIVQGGGDMEWWVVHESGWHSSCCSVRQDSHADGVANGTAFVLVL